MTTMTGDRAGFSLVEAAHYVGVSRAHIYRLLDSGVVKSFHVGRRRLILRAELDRFIQAQVRAEDGRDI